MDGSAITEIMEQPGSGEFSESAEGGYVAKTDQLLDWGYDALFSWQLPLRQPRSRL